MGWFKKKVEVPAPKKTGGCFGCNCVKTRTYREGANGPVEWALCEKLNQWVKERELCPMYEPNLAFDKMMIALAESCINDN